MAEGEDLGLLRQENAALRAELEKARRERAAPGAPRAGPTAGEEMLLQRAQEELRRSEQLRSAIFNRARDAISIVDDEGRYVEANDAAAALLGLSREQLIGKSVAEFAAGGDLAERFRDFLAVGYHSGRYEIRNAAGMVRTVLFSATAHILPGLHLSIMRDVTDEERSLAAWRRTEDLLRNVVWNAPVILVALDKNLHYTLAEGRGLGSLGLAPGELVGKSAEELFAWTPGTAEAMARLRRGQPWRWTTSFSGVTIDMSAEPLFAADGSFAGATAVGVDVTVQHRTAEALGESERRYRRIVETTSEGVLTADAEGRATFMNRRMAGLLGRTTETSGIAVADLFSPAARPLITAALRELAKGREVPLEIVQDAAPGRRSILQVRAQPFAAAGGHFDGALFVATDVTVERRDAELRARLAAIVESSDDAIIGMTLDGTISSWNPAAERLYGYSAAEMIGTPMRRLFAPQREEELAGILRSVAQGRPVARLETIRICEDGRSVEVAETVSPIRDERGRITGASSIARDLTEKRRTEVALRRSEQQLQHAQKMEAVGRLAAGVAHDFNNLLSVMLMDSEMLLSALKEGDPARVDVLDIRAAAERASALTRQLLAFSRQQILSPRILDLNQILAGMEKMLHRLLGEDVILSLETGPRLAPIKADAGQLEQVVMNLAVNARDAMPRGGELTIATRNVDLDAEFAAEHPGVAPGPHVLLEVADTGVGMSAETQVRIFEPFFTTKEKGRGTGLGLSTVFGIVHQSGGTIAVHSEPQRGTEFRIYLPCAHDGEVAQPLSHPPEATRGRETILLVEDEDGVRAITRRILQRNGYNVLEAANGGDALLICEQHEGPIDLLLSDVVMPRMSGRQVAERLVAVRPEMRILFMSGYTDDAIVQHGVLNDGVAFLQKPLTPAALLSKVREVIDRPSPRGG